MVTFLAPFRPTLYACLRIVAGLLFSLHGIQKLFGVFGRPAPVDLASQMGLAGVIETVAGLSIALGFYASPLAFLASGQMAVAYFQQHLPQGPWPIMNGGELAALYCWLFLYIAANGSGKWSLR
jgi:putative oxidoreductase